jgi:xylulokinase
MHNLVLRLNNLLLTMTAYLMAIDVGTTGANATVFDTAGTPISAAYREYISVYPAEHHVEQDAETLVAAAFEVCLEAVQRSGIAANKIRAVAISSHRATFGFLDKDEKIIGGRFIGWQDNRAYDVLDEIAAKIPAEELYQVSGMPLAPTYSLEKILWFKRERPDIYNAAAKITFPADYILRHFGADELTTEVTNACCSGMIDVHKLDWSERILETFGIDRSKFAPLIHPGTVLGKITSETAQRSGLAVGTPIVSASGDQQCAAIGAGVIDEGLASLTLGTAGLLVVGTRHIELEKSPGLMVPSSGRIGLYELEGIQLGAAACYRWCRDQLAIPEKLQGERENADPYNLMEQRLNESVPGSHGLIFLPFLTGSGYPLWDPMAQGVFAGLRFSHTRSDMMRAVLEGVTLECCDMYNQMKNAGVAVKSLTVTGGATASPIWRQTIADVFDMPIRPLKVHNATLVALAIFAGIGAGIYKSVEDGVSQTVRFGEPIQPNPANADLFRRSYKVYKSMTEALQTHGIFREIVNLRQ